MYKKIWFQCSICSIITFISYPFCGWFSVWLYCMIRWCQEHIFSPGVWKWLMKHSYLVDVLCTWLCKDIAIATLKILYRPLHILYICDFYTTFYINFTLLHIIQKGQRLFCHQYFLFSFCFHLIIIWIVWIMLIYIIGTYFTFYSYLYCMFNYYIKYTHINRNSYQDIWWISSGQTTFSVIFFCQGEINLSKCINENG